MAGGELPGRGAGRGSHGQTGSWGGESGRTTQAGLREQERRGAAKNDACNRSVARRGEGELTGWTAWNHVRTAAALAAAALLTNALDH